MSDCFGHSAIRQLHQVLTRKGWKRSGTHATILRAEFSAGSPTFVPPSNRLRTLRTLLIPSTGFTRQVAMDLDQIAFRLEGGNLTGILRGDSRSYLERDRVERYYSAAEAGRVGARFWIEDQRPLSTH